MRLKAQKQQPERIGRKTTKYTVFLHRLSIISTNPRQRKKIFINVPKFVDFLKKA